MFDSEKPDVYEKVYEGLVEQLAAADLAKNASDLGLSRERSGAAVVPLLGRDYLVSAAGVHAADQGGAAFTHRIVLAWYLLREGRGEPAMSFVPYRQLPGGADFARNMASNVEGRLAAFFSGRLAEFKAAAAKLGGEAEETTSKYDASFVFSALPGMPLQLKFYEADEDFPAEAKLFYDITAPNFLDLECLAALGLILVLELEWADGGKKKEEYEGG
jgi:uncharacterized protein DUF3786